MFVARRRLDRLLLCPVSIRIDPAGGFGMCCADDDASWKQNSALQRHEHHREEDFGRSQQNKTSVVVASPAPAAERP